MLVKLNGYVDVVFGNVKNVGLVVMVWDIGVLGFVSI